MVSDIEDLRRRQAQQEAAMREQRRNEKDRRKAQKGIVRADRKSMRSKARTAAKEAYPDSRIVLVYNGRPIAVREVERPAQVVRAEPRPVTRLPDGPYPGNGYPMAVPEATYTGIPMGGRLIVRDPDCFGGRCEANVKPATGTPVRKPSRNTSKKTLVEKTTKGTSSKTTAKKASPKKSTSGKTAPRKCGSKR